VASTLPIDRADAQPHEQPLPLDFVAPDLRAPSPGPGPLMADLPPDSILRTFHPAVAGWFLHRFPDGPTEPQRAAWPLMSAAAAPLAATVQLLRKYRALQAQIVVYTDSIGGVSANQSLSDQRAQTVYAALTAAGIGRDRLRQHGAGTATMVASNETPQGRIENRRLEIEFRLRRGPAAVP